jgi:hypothetical protein
VAGPSSSSRRWSGVGVAASGRCSSSPAWAAVHAVRWRAGRIRQRLGRIWGSTEKRLRLVVRWVPVRRRRALGGEVAARPARGGLRPAVGGVHLVGQRGGFPCGGSAAGGRRPATEAPLRRCSLRRRPTTRLRGGVVVGGRRRGEEASDSGGQASGAESGGGLLGSAGSRPASR